MSLRRRRVIVAGPVGALALAATLLLGCATAASNQPSPASGTKVSSQGPPPRVQDCAIVSISSPSRYACNGKTYTSFQLTALRTGAKD